jgi:PhzF family phenazine biosynthesis protein
MQRIAFQHGLAETAFFVRTGPDRAKLRWFTPKVEVDLCGHATLATAAVMFRHLGQAGEAVHFETASGLLTVTRQGERLELDFPARPAESAPVPADLGPALGVTPASVRRTEHLWLCVYDRAETVAQLQPDQAALARIKPGRFIVTAPGADCDFVSRFFAPDAGIPEDPVTGSAHCTLLPYWAGRLKRNSLHARQISPRGGELWCELAGDRVRIAGHAALYMRGEISV